MFKEELDRKLIKLVKENPVLYDFNDPLYMDFNAREVVWQIIGDKMQRPATDCKRRWANIRDVYKRLLRKCLENPGSTTKSYKYGPSLSFIRPFYKDIVIDDTEWAEEEQEDIESDCGTGEYLQNDEHVVDVVQDSDYSKTGRRRERKRKTKSRISKGNSKKIKREVQIEVENRPETSFVDPSNAIQLDPEDPVDAFLVSIGAGLKSLNPYQLNLAKTKIFSIVQEFELQNILEQNNKNTAGD